jgi:hypothetical protein
MRWPCPRSFSSPKEFADRFKGRPLVYPVAKAIAFTALLLVAYVVEEVLVGLWHGKGLPSPFRRLAGGRLAGGWPWRSLVRRPYCVLCLQRDDEGDRLTAALRSLFHRSAKDGSLAPGESPNRHSHGLFKMTAGRGTAMDKHACHLAGDDRRAILSSR